MSIFDACADVARGSRYLPPAQILRSGPTLVAQLRDELAAAAPEPGTASLLAALLPAAGAASRAGASGRADPLPLLNACVTEALRLCSSSLILRVATEATELQVSPSCPPIMNHMLIKNCCEFGNLPACGSQFPH